MMKEARTRARQGQVRVKASIISRLKISWDLASYLIERLPITTLAPKESLPRAEIEQKLKEIFSRHTIDREELIPILQETQEAFKYLPAAAIQEIAKHLNIPESVICGVSTFYAQFKLTPQGKKIIRVCWGTACHVRGGIKVRAELEKVLGIKAGETTPDGEYTLLTVACIGACALGPSMMIDNEVFAKVTPKKIREIIGARPDAE